MGIRPLNRLKSNSYTEPMAVNAAEVHEMANCRKGIWKAALMLNSVLTNKEIARLGYMPMTDYYLRVREN